MIATTPGKDRHLNKEHDDPNMIHVLFFSEKTVFHGQYEPLVDSKKYQKKFFMVFLSLPTCFLCPWQFGPVFSPRFFQRYHLVRQGRLEAMVPPIMVGL